MAAIYTPPWPLAEMFTTTLYPVDMTDAVGITIAVQGGALSLLPQSDIETSHGMEDGTYIQERWFYQDGPYDSDIEATHGMEDGTYTQLRWFYQDGPYDSDFECSYGLMDGTLINKLVEADTPDEELQLAIRIEASSTMDLI